MRKSLAVEFDDGSTGVRSPTPAARRNRRGGGGVRRRSSVNGNKDNRPRSVASNVVGWIGTLTLISVQRTCLYSL